MRCAIIAVVAGVAMDGVRFPHRKFPEIFESLSSK
jgi:hypothetical protein